MANFSELLQMAQKLEHDAQCLQHDTALGPIAPRPTLGAQARKVHDMEEDVLAHRKGQVAPVRVNLRHKRSQEAAARSVAMSFATHADFEYESDDDVPDENTTLDTLVARCHSQLLNKSLETAQKGNALYQQWIHDHDCGDMVVATSRLSELSSLRSDLSEQSRALHLSSAYLGQGTHAHWGMQRDSITPGSSDWRAQRFASCMERVVSGAHSWRDAIASFKGLAPEGPLGSRGEELVGSVEQLWDAVAAVLEGASVARGSGVTGEQSTADRIRAHLEAEFRNTLTSDPDQDLYPCIKTMVEKMQHRDPNRMGHSEAPCWAQAYLCLRAGNFAGCVLSLKESKSPLLGELLPEHWPPYVEHNGRMSERDALPLAEEMAEELTPLDYEANPYRCAVILILSRGCTQQAHGLLWHHMARREVVQFAQERVWLHLALCAKPSKKKGLYELSQYQSMAATAKVTDFANPYLYCRVMLWSLCANRLVSVLIPPTVVDCLGEFSLEGLHICVLLLVHDCITDAAVKKRLQRALSAYITTLIPEHPHAAVTYLKLLPAAAEASIHALCTSPEACHALLGRVNAQGEVEEGAISKLFDSRIVQGRVILDVASALQESNISGVLLVCELMMVAMHVGDRIYAARALVTQLKATLTRVIDELDAGSILSLSHEGQDALRVAGIVLPQLEAIRGELPEVQELQELTLLAKLCGSIATRDSNTWQLVTQCVQMGLLPATARDVPRCAAHVNTKVSAATVRRILPITASLTLHAVAQESQTRSFAHLAPEVRTNLLSLAAALVVFEPRVRIPATDATASRMQQARRVLTQAA